MHYRTIPISVEAIQWLRKVDAEFRAFMPAPEAKQWQIIAGDLFFNQDGSQIKVDVGSYLVKPPSGQGLNIVADRDFNAQYEKSPEPKPKPATPGKKKKKTNGGKRGK